MFSKMLFEQVSGWHLFVEFLLAALVVVYAGAKLTSLADAVSDHLNLAKGWVGALVLATVTSMPELATSGTAVVVGRPELAFGNIFGSCCFNLAIIVMINSIIGGGSVLGRAGREDALSAGFGITLLSLALIGFFLPEVSGSLIGKLAPGAGPEVAANRFEWIYCALIAACYLAFMRMLFHFNSGAPVPAQQTLIPGEGERPGPKRLYRRIGLVTILIVAAAIWLTKTGDVLADHPFQVGQTRFTLGGTFVGAFFLAAATSLPEMTTAVAAIRLGHLDMALGNIFGSNMFNIFVIAVIKFFTIGAKNPLLFDVTAGLERSKSVLTCGLAILLSGIVVVSVVHQGKRRLFGMGADSILIGLVYVLGMVLLLTGGK